MPLDSAVLPWLAVGISLIALAISSRSYHHAAEVAQAQTVASFMEEYASREMREALELLGVWQRRYSLEIRRSWRNGTLEEAQSIWGGHLKIEHEGERLADARRMVHWYFKKAHRLYEMDYLTKKSMQVITEANGYRLLFEIVWPLTRVQHLAVMGRTDEKRFKWLADLKRDFPPDRDE